MAFNNVGLYTLAGLKSHSYIIWFGGNGPYGSDMGAQYISAMPLNSGEVSCLFVYNQTQCNDGKGNMQYSVTVQNLNSDPVSFSLHGGGFA